MFEIVITLLTCIMLCVTLVPLLPSNHWLSRVWEFPRVQIAVLTVSLAIASFFLSSPSMAIVLVSINGLLSVYQIAWIFPYTRLYPIQVKKAVAPYQQSIKIMTSNVLMTNHSADKLIKLIRLHQPDVVVTLETDQWWEDALQPIHSEYPHRVNSPLDNLYGMHLYSKFVLEDVQLLDLIEEGIPSIHCYLVLKNNIKVKCHFLHPAPPSPTENTTSTPRDQELLVIAKQVAGQTEPIIVTGDLNDVAWSPTTRAFRRISGLKDPRMGRGMFNTFHASYPIMRWPLDHIFHSEHFELGTIQRMPSIDSDHFPLLSELVYVNK
ncbi:endonuclease/exonuclease/phosphatase family protein [Psychromonas sp. SR45-3]|uniref:endonuclease/exonuclease/phosphatase family protein n=1 Tax=Psychromonas sp. SR45-3 TaxID=2760930 RepID=UPI0015FAF9D7|nr:endonuclease/exonuclease/phosphatase family protein [Psychromonas sp. SR45-3]MBB1273705.1 endonuclease/exonuclease/phosphatase family protein [Psychromonas sp. SR45-3]